MSSNLRIEDYALIGDCATAALVGRNGSIDWLCLPRFDSPACFAALLGTPEHGRWLIAPADPAPRVERRYIDHSLVLATTFETETGAVELIDFFRPRHGPLDLVRLVRGLRGRVAMCVEFVLRFDYGSLVPWVEQLPGGRHFGDRRAGAGGAAHPGAHCAARTSKPSASSRSAPARLSRSC